LGVGLMAENSLATIRIAGYHRQTDFGAGGCDTQSPM